MWMCWSCSAQRVHDRQKSLCACCSFQKPRVSMAAIYVLFSPVELHFSGYATTYIHAVTNAQTKHTAGLHREHKHTHKLAATVLATAAQQRRHWGSLLLVCFLLCLVSIGTLRNCRRREGGKKEQNLPALDAPCFHPTSIHPLPFLHPTVQLCAFITCGNRRSRYRLFTQAEFRLLPECVGLPQMIWFFIPACSTDSVKGFLLNVFASTSTDFISVTYWSHHRASSSCMKNLWMWPHKVGDAHELCRVTDPDPQRIHKEGELCCLWVT